MKLNPTKHKKPVITDQDYKIILTENPVYPYYRQSTEEQYGNQSTFIQLVDSRDVLLRMGWREDLIMSPIEDDKGYSGSLGPEERPGLARLLTIIETTPYPISVYVSILNRLFRDGTQILFNQFIQVCIAHKTRIITQHMQYHFAHPQQGEMHIQMFRNEMVDAARFLKVYIQETLHAGKERLAVQGFWVKGTIPTGYMIDKREIIGTRPNPNYRRLEIFDYFAPIMQEYFALYKRYDRNLKSAYHHIERYGPFFPEDYRDHVPAGYKISFRIVNRSKITHGLMPMYNTLRGWYMNPIFAGHFVHQGAIIKMNNHPPLIDNALFMFAFETLSRYKLNSTENEYYREHSKSVAENRSIVPPIYGSFLFSDDNSERGLSTINTTWVKNSYRYVLQWPGHFEFAWSVKADHVDVSIDKLVRLHLERIVINASLWTEVINEYQGEKTLKSTMVQRELNAKKHSYQNLRISLAQLHDRSIVSEVEADLIKTRSEIERLSSDYERLIQFENKQINLESAQKVLEILLARWSEIERTDKIYLLKQLITVIMIREQATKAKVITIYWKDGTCSSDLISYHNPHYTVWENGNQFRVKELLDNHVDQVEILKEFPNATWRDIRRCYARYFNNGRVPTHYTGVAPYLGSARWENTDEAKQLNNTNATDAASSEQSQLTKEIIPHLLLAYEQNVLTSIQTKLLPVPEISDKFQLL